MNYFLSELAKEDLENIYAYTVVKWSSKQAEIYYSTLIAEIDRLCEHPTIGESISFIKSNHRILFVKSHAIIYKIEENCIYVDRILHKRMKFITLQPHDQS